MRLSHGTGRQSPEDIDAIDLKDVSLMIDVTRLKHQDSGFLWIDARAIKCEGLCRAGERDAGLDFVEGSRFIAKVLPLEEYDGEIGCHGFEPLFRALRLASDRRRRQAASRSTEIESSRDR
jgi:hypothetical protein